MNNFVSISMNLIVCSILAVFIFFNSLSASLADVKDALYSMSAREEMAAPVNKNWVTDFDAGLKKAKEASKPILVAFVGLPWCPWSEKMDQEILSRLGFIEPLKHDVVLVRVNLAEEGKETKSIRERFNISELPFLLLLDQAGNEISKLGYLPMEPEAFAARIQSHFAAYNELDKVMQSKLLTDCDEEELKSLYLKAKEFGFSSYRDKLYLAGLQLNQGFFFLLEQYANYADKGRMKSSEAKVIKKKILAKDPKNIKGAHRALAILDFQAFSNKRSKKKYDEKKVLEPLLSYVKKFGKQDKEHLWRIEMLMAQYYFGKNNAKEALEHAKTAFAEAPQDQQGEITQTIAFLEGKLQPAKSPSDDL